jgi:hypothetical protein
MSWDSKKQQSIALTTIEAEYISSWDTCIEAMWLCKLVSGLFDQAMNSTVIYCNDQSYVNLSENSVFHDWSNHIEIRNYIICDKFQMG